ncbi:hypothetical protein B0J18DRAFT_374239 [Chaetomium sp. MPI-SDFR-AT-0129]|nr:hypothetical protein B0J18DRAFT_374239 [Chaetomium sp. MPI-SDFR-AT-0129]
MSVSTSSAPTMAASINSIQPGGPLTFQFTNVQDLFDVINRTSGDFLAVTNVYPHHFLQIQHEREKRRRKIRFRRYDSSSGILTIKLPTALHEALHMGIYMRYCAQLVRKEMSESWKDIGSTTFRDVQGYPSGEGDSTGGPWPECTAPSSWPTLVVDSGHSEALDDLRNDMRWWFEASNHEVKIVVLAKFDYQKDHIILEKWEEEIATPQGPITRRRASVQQQNSVLEAVKRQTITITRDGTTNPVSYNVDGPLVLGFRLLFLRDPGPQEGDFILDIETLQRYAYTVWAQLPISD